MKKSEAEEFVSRNQDHTIVNNDGHYFVVTPEGKKIANVLSLPVEKEVQEAKSEEIIVATETLKKKNPGRHGVPVKDLQTGIIYLSKDAASKATGILWHKVLSTKLEDGTLRFVKVM